MTTATVAPDGGMPLPQPETLDRYPADARAVRIAYDKIPANRLFALDPTGERGLVALWRAAWRVTGDSFKDTDFQELLGRVAPYVPTLTQGYRLRDKDQALPELPSDDCTKQYARNPFAADDSVSVASRQIVKERNPALAEHLQRLAKDGGYSLKYHFELEDAKTRREALLKFKYSDAEHRKNPFLVSGGEINQTELGTWLQTTDPLVVEVYRLEAQPPRVPWGDGSKNLTQMSAMFTDLKNNPVAGVDGTVITLAAAIDTALLEALRKQAAADERAAKDRQDGLK